MNKKFRLSIILSTILLIFSNSIIVSKGLELKSKKLDIKFDDNLHLTIAANDFNGLSIIEENNAVQVGIKINDKMISDFKIDPQSSKQESTNDVEFGPSIKGIVVGRYHDGRLNIERETEVLLPQNFPLVMLMKTKFRNDGGKKIRIDKVFSQHLLLNRQLAEPEKAPYDFASFQGGVYDWGKDYSLIWLKPGFYQSNFQGIHKLTNYSNGGGIPLIDIWGKTMGVAIAHIEKQPEWLSLPVKVRKDNRVEVAIVEEPDENLGQQKWLNPGESYETVLTAVILHKLDFYNALRTYANLLRSRGIEIRETSTKFAYEPYWKTWGFRLNWTTKEIINLLPELKAIEIKMILLDGGWFDYEGDWNPSRARGKFPDGEKDIIAFVKKIKQAGFRTGIWWYPNAVNPKSELAKEHPDLLIQAKDGSFPNDEENHNYQLCPAYEPALEYVEKIVERFINKWGFDGVYMDKMGLSAALPCFNKKHHHKSPLDSFHSLPNLFKRIEIACKKYNPDPYIEMCICSAPHSPYNMPYYYTANASDPVNNFQLRRRIKVEKALHGPTFDVGDCYEVPEDQWTGASVCQSFESAFGIGAQLTTFYASLDSAQLSLWKHWFHKYNRIQLSSGTYKNYYDIAFDKPEAHVVQKGKDIYYGFYADLWPVGKEIELRGLNKNMKYKIYDYANNRDLGMIDGSDPYIKCGFKESLLIKASPVHS